MPLRTRAQGSRVTICVSDAYFKQVIDAVEKQTNFLFVIGEDVDILQKISLDLQNIPVKEALTRIAGTIKADYRIEGSNIFLSAKNNSAGQLAAGIDGQVVDANGQPMQGVTVLVHGTTVGTTTDLHGNFRLIIPASCKNPELSVSFLGYETSFIPVGLQTFIHVTLKESSVDVNEVVVTAMGIKRSEKALSYNAQIVNDQDILAVKDVNFVNALSGKVAGVNINASSSGVGGASKVIMRGVKSIEQSSNALYVIDGVPVLNFQSEGGMEFASAGSSEAIADINPEDIESMTVLTGAAAAALYGSNGANGAIVITTKKGRAGYTNVTVTSNTEVLMPFVMPQFQNRYGTGIPGMGETTSDKSWGLKLNKAGYMGYQPQVDYFQTGVIGTETVSFSTGNEHNQTYLSAGSVNSKGIIPNNSYDRYNFTGRNTSSFLKDRMTLDFGASYVRQKDLNMTNQGIHSNPLTSAYLFPRGEDWEKVRMYETWDPTRKIYVQNWDVGAGDFIMQNPYWINYRNLRENKKDRYMLYANVSYKILDWLNVSGRIRMDNSNSKYTEKLYATTNNELTELSGNGLYGFINTLDKQIYGDVLVNIDKTFNHEISLHANIGGSFSNLESDAEKTRGPIRDGSVAGENAGIPNVFNTFNLSLEKTRHEQAGWREQTQSVFASVELGYKNTYFLTVTGRNDWPTQLAGPNSTAKSFFYPSIGGSIVFSQIFRMPEQLHYLKLRGSYASVGLAFARHIANPTHGWLFSNDAWDEMSQYPMNNLKPEKTKSWEIGLTARFLRNFNLDITYYNTKTVNQTFDPKISAGSGYSNIYLQSGNILNRGVELSLGYRNKWNKFSWSSMYVFSCNQNEILQLADNAVNPITGEKFSISHLDMGGLGQTRFILRKGGSLGDIYSTADLKRDSDGLIYVDEAGKIEMVSDMKDIDSWIKLGSVLPKANMSWRNDFEWGNFNFGFMISARIGGVVYSRTQAALDYYGVSEASAAARDRGGVGINNGSTIDAYEWYSTIGKQNGIPQYYTYSATNVRLQEANIGYTIPRSKLGDVVDITLSLVGRNLWMICNRAPFDPESVATTGNYYQGIDYFMMPNTRNIGFNVRLKF